MVCLALLFDSIINSIENHCAHALFISQYDGIILVKLIKNNIYHGSVVKHIKNLLLTYQMISLDIFI